jgi:cytidine deaminase
VAEVNPTVEQLRALAQSVSEHAYSPHSRLKVGAVAVDSHGNTHTGCNVENASFGLTQCAERNALGAAIAAGAQPGTLHTLLVYSAGFQALSPCGACRQVMAELLAPDARVISCGDDQVQRTWAIGELLPDPFIID